jgi:hypothetical protein
MTKEERVCCSGMMNGVVPELYRAVFSETVQWSALGSEPAIVAIQDEEKQENESIPSLERAEVSSRLKR